MISIIGSSNLDMVMRMPALPELGQTVLGGSYSENLGGKGANQAVAAQRANGNIHFYTKVGKDAAGKKFKTQFIEEGLPKDGILEDSNAASGIAHIWVSEKGDNSIVVAAGANMQLFPEDLSPFEKKIRESAYLVTQLETPVQTLEWLGSLAAQHEAKLILNPAPASLIPSSVWQQLWLLTPNETELSLLTGMPVRNPDEAQIAARAVIGMGASQIIVTLGSKGCLWANKYHCEFFPAFSVIALDTTAAGDVFNGTLAVALDEGKSIPEAIRFASAAAAISVARLGAQPSIPYRNEIESFLLSY
ncbi:MAG: ribokinase [Cytophagaceae bacterium]|jgi:ribokinase|nr:ribokinase [Cytophagaceae bacterium]